MTYWPLIVTIVEICWFLAISTWLLLEGRSPTATIAWIFALTFLPLIGIPVYMALGPRRLERRKLQRTLARRAVQTGMVTVGAIADPRARRMLPESETLRQIVAMSIQAGEAPPARIRDFEIYTEGAPLYAAMEAAIRAACHHLHLEYYIWTPDETGTRFRDLLCERARAGVRVRLLLDAFGSHAATRRRFLRPLTEAGVEVAVFNPVKLARFRYRFPNFRTHRKILIADGRVAFTGGVNITDTETETVSGGEAWRDTHLRMEGDAVRWLQLVFLEDWYFATDLEAPMEGLFDDSPPEGDQLVQVVSSGPDQDTFAIHRLFFAAIAGARERILLTTPYFVPDEPIMTALVTAARRGVRVRMLVPRRTDSLVVGTAARTYYDELLAERVEIHTYTPRMIHAKTMVVDRQLAIVGTANMDDRSFRLNFEIVVALYGTAPSARLASIFRDDVKASERLAARTDRSVAERVVESLARLFSPVL